MASPTSSGGGTEVPPVLPSIPLSAEVSSPDSASTGSLVGEATRHLETMVKGQLELAKFELKTEVKKAALGGVFFVVALAILVFSLFFFFFFVVELLNQWLLPWASNLIVFGVMLLSAGLCALFGFLRVRKIHPPERTISSVKESAAALRR